MAKEFKMSQARYDELKQELDYSKTTRADEVAELLHTSGAENAVLVYSGDTGFYSGAAALLDKLSALGIRARVLPGLSSVQLLAAALGLSLIHI